MSNLHTKKCNDDHKLNQVIQMLYDAMRASNGEHQGDCIDKKMSYCLIYLWLMKLFGFVAIILQSESKVPQSVYRNGDNNNTNNIQMCFVGDHKQILCFLFVYRKHIYFLQKIHATFM